jgi:hypothetical protein
MSVLGTVAGIIFSGAAAAGGTIIVRSIAPQWQRILRLAMGHIEPMPGPPLPPPSGPDRWRRMHLDADQRPPVSKIRAGALSRGLPGWMVRR